MKNSLFFNTIAAFLSLWLCAVSSYSANYYAAPNVAGVGTLADPCSLNAGFAKADLDTLFLRGGQYDFTSVQRFAKTGTATARKALFAYKDEKPVLDFRGEAYGSRGVQFAGAYLHIKGITICYSGKNGFYNESNYSIFENCETYGNGDTGFQLKNCHGNLIKNCDSHDNFDYKLGDVTAADYGGNADGFADKQYDDLTAPNEYEGCRSWNNSDDGWDMFDRKGITFIRNSWCYNNGPATYDMTNHPRYQTDKSWFDQFPRTITDKNGNTHSATLAAYPNFGNGNGFKVGGNYRNNTVTLENCLSANNSVKGFDQNNNAGSMTLYNCTAYGNNPDYGFTDRSSDNANATNPNSENPASHATLTLKNCISLATKRANTFTSASYLTSSSNSWNTIGVSCAAGDFVSLDATQIVIARNADGSLPEISFMHLVPGSSLIDNGEFVGLPYAGALPDLGCFELGDDVHYPPTVSAPANRNQSVTENIAIEPIVFSWGGSATGLNVSDLPAGINPIIDSEAKTLTLTGAPNTMGVYNYTVTAVSDEGVSMEVSGTIVVSSANAKKIAYITTPDSPADVPILNKLNANLEFKVTIINATTTNVDYGEYDLVIVSPVPGSASAGLVPVKTLDKPKLLLKPFQLKTSVWNWVTADSKIINTKNVTMKVTDKSHEIFRNLTFTGINSNELQIYSQEVNVANAVTGITSDGWRNTAVISELATDITTAATQSIVEIPVGSAINGTTINSRFLMIGISESSSINLTPTATQLIENSCYYLLGIDLGAGIDFPTGDRLQLTITNGLLNLSEPAEISLYDASGKLLKVAARTQEILVVDLPQGVYIVRAKTLSGELLIKKFVK